MRAMIRAGLFALCALLWLCAACAAKEEVIPIIHVSPGFESRLALRPPVGSALDSSIQDSAGDAGASETSAEKK